MAPAVAAAAIMAASNIGMGLFNSAQESSRREDARNYLTGQKGSTDSDYADLIQQINNYYGNRGSLGTSDDVSKYKALISGFNPEDYTYTPEKTFDQTYTKTKEDFINPYYDQIIQDTANKIQHTAAGAGIGRNPGTLTNIARAVAEKDNELYKEANELYNTDRDFAYKTYSDYIQNMQDNLNRKLQATQTQMTAQGNLAQDYYNAMDSRQSDLLKAQQDRINANTSYATAMAGLY